MLNSLYFELLDTVGLSFFKQIQILLFGFAFNGLRIARAIVGIECTRRIQSLGYWLLFLLNFI